MTPDAGPGTPGPRRLPSRPVSRPPRLRPTTRPTSRRPAGGPGAVLRSLSGALLAVAAVSLGVVVLLALQDPGDGDTLLATGQGSAQATASPEPASPPPPSADPPSSNPAQVEPTPAEPVPVPAPAEPAPAAPPVPADVTVTVLGVGGPEVAEPTAARLRERGWTVRLVASYRGQPPAATTLFHVQGREEAAALLAASTGAAVRPAPVTLSESDLTLVVPG
jgi:hypothetical protein